MYFFCILLVLTCLNLPIYLQYKKGVQEHLLAQEEASIISATQMLQREMYEQLHLLDLIIKSYILKEYLAEGTQKQHLRVEKSFQDISTSFHRFDQIRLLDNTGQEKIRINLVAGVGQIVAKNQLQNKANRYYFKNTQQLPTGQIYISKLDLNIENETLELPHKPTLRFATALKNKQGNPAGVLVINYLAKGMLDHFRELITQRHNYQGMLVDNQGYWLANKQKEKEWGADLNRPEQNLANEHPKLWAEMNKKLSGVYETKKGVYRYHTIDPLNFTHRQPAHFRLDHHPLIAKESYTNTNWKMVVFLPREFINSHTFLYQPLGQILLVFFILLIASLSLLAASFTVQKRLNRKKELATQALLEKQATLDELTNINNRRHFYQLGEAATQQALEQKKPLAALMLDADYFKKINDTYGHATGDLVLKKLAKTIVNNLSDLAILGRIGGEEFAVLIPNTNLNQAQEVAERLRKALAACKVTTAEGADIKFTVSIGISLLTNQDLILDKLLQKADLALYQAKKLGRNRVEYLTD